MEVQRYMPSILCVLAAMTIALINIEGWGWFLFAAMILFPKNKKDNDDE